ncbi:MAG TPA: DUF1854 domain-containing protein [Blastocatellia bacterium]|nr:DUF1854 domain-containing protein [Blastocatellia bacterium]
MSIPVNEEKPPETPVTLIDASQLVFLDTKKLRFFAHGATLRLTVEEDRSYLTVSVLRAFPLSEPNRFLSVRDGENKEVGLIVNPADLDVENWRLVEEELERRYLMPTITRIVAAQERFGTVDWTMETNRGLCRFTTRNLGENVQRPSPGRVILSDVDGNRYDIRNLDDLSLASQELLFRHI